MPIDWKLIMPIDLKFYFAQQGMTFLILMGLTRCDIPRSDIYFCYGSKKTEFFGEKMAE